MSFSHTQEDFFFFCIFLLNLQPKFTETTLIYFEDYIMNQFLLVCGKLIKKNIVLAWNNKNRFMILLLYIWHIFSNFIYLKAISIVLKIQKPPRFILNITTNHHVWKIWQYNYCLKCHFMLNSSSSSSLQHNEGKTGSKMADVLGIIVFSSEGRFLGFKI